MTKTFVLLKNIESHNDAMLLRVHFCKDLFSISLAAVNKGVSYSLYARCTTVNSVL